MIQALWVAIEGGEGAGKSTLIQKLQEHYSQSSTFVEPAHDSLGGLARAWVMQQVHHNPRAETLLFFAARSAQWSEKIAPRRAEPGILFCDRFHGSTLAYQGYGHGLDISWLEQLALWSTEGQQPDCTLWLDIAPKDGVARSLAASIANHDAISTRTLCYHQKVYDGFVQLAKRPHWHRIDANQPLEMVFHAALSILDTYYSQ